MHELEGWLKAKGGLPSYAVPRFVRILVDDSGIQHGLENNAGGEHVSSIMKKMKTELRKQGKILRSPLTYAIQLTSSCTSLHAPLRVCR